MVEIKPGLELDKAVADAIGLKWHDREMEPFVGVLPQAVKREAGYWFSDGTWYERIPAFSTDLNAAFAAAEKVTDYVAIMKHELSNGLWECKLVPADSWDEWVKCNTPALAICAAILKLKGDSDG